MTICIAAATFLPHHRKGIVLCADWRRSGVMGSSETSLKVRMIHPRWFALTAGDEPEINAILPLLREAFDAVEIIDETNINEIVRGVLTERKRQKADELLRGQYGVSYTEFLASWKDKLPAELYRDAILYIRDMRISAEFIIAGFYGLLGYPIIIDTDGNGGVHIREDFTAIGEASYVAQSVMLNREHIDVRDLNKTLYTVYEAKKYAEKVVSVGASTYISILEQDGTETPIAAEVGVWLEEQWKAMGPRPLEQLTAMPSTIYEQSPPTDNLLTLVGSGTTESPASAESSDENEVAAEK